MPFGPSSSLATLRPDLGDSLREIDLTANMSRYIGDLVAPPIETAEQGGTFGKITLEQLLKKRGTQRTSNGAYPRSGFDFTTGSFACEEHGHEVPVDHRNAAVYANYFDAEMVAAQLAQHAVRTAYEQRVAALVFNATTFSSQKTSVSTEWSTTTAKPVTDVKTAKLAVYNRTGIMPNALVIGVHAFEHLRVCDQVIDAIASAGAGDQARVRDITTAQLAAVFDLDMVLVGGGSKNTANEGQTASIAPIWDDEYAMVCRVARTNSIAEPCIARTFHWGRDGSRMGAAMESYGEQAVRGDVIRARMDTDEQILVPELGQLLDNISA